MKNNKNQYWRNLKNGKTYQYVGKATDATNGNEGIEYAVYSDGEVLYVRKFEEFTKKFEQVKFKYNPEHKIGTCLDCGEEMVYNVPRLGDKGGFIHKNSKKLECEYPKETLGSQYAREIREKLNDLSPEERERLYNEAMKTIYNQRPKFPPNTLEQEGGKLLD